MTDDAPPYADCTRPTRFQNMNLAGAAFRDVNLRGALFDDVALTGATIRNACLGGVDIADANLEGMRIDGVLVSDLFAAWRARDG